MSESEINSMIKDKQRTDDSSSEFGSELSNFSANQFERVFSRMMKAVGTNKAADVAEALGISQSSVSGSKRRGNIPDSWYAIIADKFGVSIDWLRTGDGEMKRRAVITVPTGAGKTMGNVELLYRMLKGASREEFNDGELATLSALAAAAGGELPENLQQAQPPGPPAQQGKAQNDHICGKAPGRRDISIADMLAKTARVLESDTVYREALYSNIEAFHHGVTMDERLGKMDAKFDQVMQRLDALESENQQLRQELEHSRAGSTLSDTG